MIILQQNALFLHQIFKHFLGGGIAPSSDPIPILPPPIPSFWIRHLQERILAT